MAVPHVPNRPTEPKRVQLLRLTSFKMARFEINVLIFTANHKIKSVREGFFWFPSARPFNSGGGGDENCVFFERVSFEKAWPSAAPALRFLAVSRFLFFWAPAHFGDLELTGTKNMLP